MKVEQWLNNFQLGIDIFNKKYRHEDESLEDFFDRVSGGNKELRNIIVNKKFLFGGRILANRGINNIKTTFSNCYVLPIKDSLEDIFKSASDMAKTYSYGGGCGIDFRKIRPTGAKVNNSAKTTTGSVSFMELMSSITGLIAQNGRKGALMISLPCDHPDIEEFIDIKSDLNKITKANISIKINNDFLKAVNENENYQLKFTISREKEPDEVISKTINAKELLMKIAKASWSMAEPGVVNWDRVENWNLLSEYDNFEFEGLNPCGEEPLPAFGACLLGSVNLSAFVKKNQKNHVYFDFSDFHKTVEIATIAMDEVLDEGIERHALQEQKETAKNWRQMGLGIFGLSDMLIQMQIKYGSPESIELCGKIAKVMINCAVATSSDLAKEKGSFPLYDYNALVKSEFYKNNLTDIVKEKIKQNGLRNSQLLTVAPTGTISNLLGVSGGIEPIYALSYNRKTESLHGKDQYYEIFTPIVEKYMKKHNIQKLDDLPEYFITAKEISYENRIAMQSIWQKYIDASISSTINLPKETSIEDVYNLYLMAFSEKYNLKGLTIYRDGCNREGILSEGEEKNKDVSSTTKLNSITPLSRDSFGKISGTTDKLKTACGTLYITTNKNDGRDIVETFINTPKTGVCSANSEGMSRLASLCLRSGIVVDEIIDQLRGITCSACVRLKAKGEKIDGLSCPDILSKAIKAEYLFKAVDKIIDENEKMFVRCPECGEELRFEGGCNSCISCGYSKCS